MEALATTADAVRLGYTLPAGREEALLARASARLRRLAGRPISSTTSTVRRPVQARTVLLPGGPITGVSAIARLPEDGGASVTGWRWDGAERVYDVNVRPTGSSCQPVDVLVTYTHGLVVVPDELLELVCSVAVRLGATEDAAGMEAGIRSETIDDYSVTYAAEAVQTAAGLLPGEEDQLHAFLGAPPGAYVVGIRRPVGRWIR